MPHLLYGSRYWRVSSDELALPAVCAVAGRTFWSIVLLCFLSFAYRNLEACPDSGNILAFLFISCAVFLASIGVELCIVSHSTRGTIVEVEKRAGMKKYLSAHVLLAPLQFALSVWGLCIVQRRSSVPCASQLNYNNSLDVVLLSVVVISQLVDIVATLFAVYLFSVSNINDEDNVADEQKTHTLWEGRCRSLCRALKVLCCNLFGGANVGQDIEAVAKVLTVFFHHDGFLDVVPSDVVAGILLVRLQQRSRKFAAEAAGAAALDLEAGAGAPRREDTDHEAIKISRRRSLLDGSREWRISSDADIAEMALIYRCSRYALATYTHLLFLYMRPCTGLCSLVRSRLCAIGCQGCCCCSPSAGPRRVLGDNACRLNEAAVYSHLGPLRSQLVYASFRNDVQNKPFLVFMDREEGAIFVAVRGTLSLEDCLTDALATATPLEKAGQRWGFDGGGWAHSGFLLGAQAIREELHQGSVLEEAAGGEGRGDPLRLPLNSSDGGGAGDVSKFKLVVLGHSLGAGIAVLLTMLLRPAYPHVQCVSFGTPGSVVDYATARSCADYVTSVVLHNDMVSRLSFHALVQLRRDVLENIARAKVGKLAIMKSALYKRFNVDDFMYRRGDEPDSSFKQNVTAFLETVGRRVAADTSHSTELFIPGRLLHFVRQREGGGCGCAGRDKYVPMQAALGDFSEVEIGSSMALDHFPDRYFFEMKRVYEEACR